MILVHIQQINTSKALLQSAFKLAVQLEKSFAISSFVDSDEQIANRENELKTYLTEQNLKGTQLVIRNSKTNSILQVCEEVEAAFLFIQLPETKSGTIRSLLSACRELRIPYLLYKDSFVELNLKKLILPIGFLEEELEKAQFASAFGRFCNTEIVMLLANDYGSKAAKNAEKMELFFEKFQLSCTLQKAKADSFGVEKEAIQIAENEHAGIVIASASRDYGLDDILFGPKEFHVVKKSTVPVLLVNPRGDLYALCD